MTEGRKAIPEYMSQFFEEVASIKRDINTIKSATKKADEIRYRQLVAASPGKEDEESRGMQSLLAAAQNQISVVKARLAALKRNTDQLSEDGTLKLNERRVRENLHIAVQRKFLATFDAFRTAQQKYSDDVRSKVKRQVRVLQPEASDDFVEGVLQDDDGLEKLYEQAIIKGAATKMTQQYERTVERHNDAKRLERAVLELSQMFLDFSVIVHEQGELLNSIECSVVDALQKIEAGNEDVAGAIKYQKRARKWQCRATGMVVASLAFAGFALFAPTP